jgi:hypothetical protein
MFSLPSGLEQQLDPAKINSFLHKALIRQGIKTEYEFAVIQWDKRISYRSKTSTRMRIGALPYSDAANDFFDSKYFNDIFPRSERTLLFNH